MIVSDQEIDIWKGHHKGKEGGIFNEIYTESEVDDLIVCLKKWKKDYDEMVSEYGQYALCPPPPRWHGCGVEAKGFEEITEIFGYRGKRVQSLDKYYEEYAEKGTLADESYKSIPSMEKPMKYNKK